MLFILLGFSITLFNNVRYFEMSEVITYVALE